MKSGFFKRITIAAIFLWMVFLHWVAAKAAEPSVDADRLRTLSDLKGINLSAFVPMPQILLKPVYFTTSELPKDLQLDKDRDTLEKLFNLRAAGSVDKAYIDASNFLKTHKKSGLSEWIQIVKADFLYEIQLKKGEKRRLSLSLQEYQDVLREFPLNLQVPRVLYQIALTQLQMGFYDDSVETCRRAIKEHGENELAALYHLLIGEDAFLSQDDLKATFEFSYIIDHYPRSRAAADSAYRKAFILFRKGDFKNGLKTYTQLEKFHSDEIQNLRMLNDPEADDKYVDRIYYAETIFLNDKYAESAKLFQDLINLFPTHSLTPFLIIRLGDTYLYRNQNKAAEQLYDDVLVRYKSNTMAQSIAKMRIADLFYITNDLRASKQNEKLLQSSFENARDAKNTTVAALALAKLAQQLLAFRIIPKAQEVLSQYLNLFDQSDNQKWVHDKFIYTVEVQILDYYNREDYLAALTTYLVYDRQLKDINDTRVLIKLSDAAKRLSLYDKASEILNRVVYLEKTSEGRQEALLKLVDILITRNELKKASERLRRFNFAYPLTPLDYLYEMYWGMLYSALKNTDQSIIHFEKAVLKAKGRPSALFEIRQVHMRLAEQYEKITLTPKAIESYEKFVRMITDARKSPLSAENQEITEKDLFLLKVSRYRIADLYFEMRDYVRALEAYQDVSHEIKDEPFLSHALYQIGECYLGLEDRASALKAFAVVKSDDPANLWMKAAQNYIKSVQMEVKYGIRIFN